MSYENLAALQRQMQQYQQLKNQESMLQRNIATMESILPRLKDEAIQEQEDVDNLENGGIVSILYSAIGRRDEKLEKERMEARLAQNKYQDALRKCQSLYQELESVRAQLTEMKDCTAQYQRAFQEKQKTLLQGGGADSVRLRQLGEQAARLNAEQKEIREALDAGDLVLSQIAQVEDALKGASDWGVMDMIGGGFISDMAKYSNMDRAQHQMEELNRLMKNYSQELKDLELNLNINIEIGSGLKMADFFFDNFFTDAMAYDHIRRLRDQVSEMRRRVQYYRDMLLERKSCNSESIDQLKQQAETLIVNA